MRLFLFISSFFIFSANIATAATLNFGKVSNECVDNNLFCTSDDTLDITVRARYYIRETRESGTASISTSTLGLGIITPQPNLYTKQGITSDPIDGRLGGEKLSLKFSEPVLLKSFTLAKYRNDTNSFIYSIFPTDIPSSGSGSTYSILTRFTFTGTTATNTVKKITDGMSLTVEDEGSAFFLQGIEYKRLTAVPLPAALPLYAAGMGLLGLFRWRKGKRATA